MVRNFSPLQLSEEKIISRLKKINEPPQDEAYPSALLSDAPKPAAVLVPLLIKYLQEYNDYSWHVLLTRRSDSLIEHKGQVAFPGGRSDIDDSSPEVTALREANEEIGISPEEVRVLGRLDGLLTISNYLVTPVVGVIPWPYEFKLASNEVSRVFTIPFNWLANPDNHTVHLRDIPPPYSSILQSNKYPVIYFKAYDGEVLWGVSAEITMRLIKTLFD
jgi:8-oxo-dGTP pyrophosphatase MutT (NUDIX family)